MRQVFLGFVGALCAVAAIGQPVAPVYPSYEGYTPNEDGSFTLVFGYYNPNAVSVEIQPGEANGFEPGPDDRGQPTEFLPGRQRNVCFVVVGPEFEGKNLQWRLSWAGETVATTDRGGPDPLYLLEDIGSAYRRAQTIDISNAPRNVCVNTAPSVRLFPPSEARAGEAFALRAFVSDDRLPRGSSLELRWQKVSGPGDVSFDDTGSSRPRVTVTEPGSYELRFTASDGDASTEQTVTVTVRAP